MLNRKILIFVPAVILVCFVLGLVSCQGESDSFSPSVTSEAAETKAGMAPDFALTDVNGEVVSLSDFKGKVVIVDFWATWCPPCQAGIPHFQSLYQEYSDKGLVIIGIALDQGGMNVVRPFVESYGVTYPIVMGNPQVVSSYGGIRGLPTAFIIGRDGVIVEKIVGYRDKAFFENAVKKLL